MIEQVVTWPYLKSRIQVLLEAMESEEGRVPEGRAPAGANELEPADFANVATALSAALELPPDDHAGDSARTGGGSPEPLENRALISRDEATSLVQSALEAYFEEQRPELIEIDERSGRGAAPGDVAPVTNVGLSIHPEASAGRGLAGQFEITDIGWVNSVLAMGWRRLKKRRQFVDRPARPQRLGERARVILVGDWGSGTPRAHKVAAQIRKVIEPDIGRLDQHVIHLGDVYYSGWKREYEQRFLPPWPVREGEPVGSWCLNGNHDMYSGGHAYFDYLLQQPRFAAQGGSSWFSIENDQWQLLGLDSSWRDHDLEGSQAAWVGGKVRDHPSRRTMLLTHHQPFSVYGSDGPKLRAALAEPLSSGRVTSWFWGHEHRCVRYEQGHEGVGWGRLVGHGGVPVYAHNEPLILPAVYQYTDSFDAGLENWAIFGFVALDIEGPRITARYINEYGGEDDCEEIG